MLGEYVKQLYDKYGQRKEMGISAENVDTPHYFLHRTFLGDQDLLVIFNTKRCRYQCNFCQLPAKSSVNWIPSYNVLNQFKYVLTELKHSVSVLTRVTIANEGSVLDFTTFPEDALFSIAESIAELRMVRRLVFESRLEFCTTQVLMRLKECVAKSTIDILTGFESLDQGIRDRVLFKRESIQQFIEGLDAIGDAGVDLTCYILYKPDPRMSDEDALNEARRSFEFLKCESDKRNINLKIRINPMYLAKGSKWASLANRVKSYLPPRLTDVMKIAQEIRASGVRVYIGLSTEGLDESAGTYLTREDYSGKLIRPIKLFNDNKVATFSGYL